MSYDGPPPLIVLVDRRAFVSERVWEQLVATGALNMFWGLSEVTAFLFCTKHFYILLHEFSSFWKMFLLPRVMLFLLTYHEHTSHSYKKKNVTVLTFIFIAFFDDNKKKKRMCLVFLITFFPYFFFQRALVSVTPLQNKVNKFQIHS